MAYSYKCLAAPRRARKTKGHRSPAEAFAAAFESVLAEQAAAGGEYLRTDLAPVEARAGVLGRVVETHQAVMVFRRPAPGASSTLAPEIGAPDLRAEPALPRLGAARLD